MIRLRSAKHHWLRLLFFVVLSASMLISACDDYNIVEPRFYTEADVVQIVECGFDPYAEPEDGAGYRNTTGVVQPKNVPTSYSVDACWFNRAEGVLAVFITLPTAGDYTVSLLNSGGGVETVIHEGVSEAGLLVFPCVIDDDGVYALSAQTEQWTGVVWFEVN